MTEQNTETGEQQQQQQGGGEQQGEQNWLTSVPENIRGHEVFKGMDKAGDVYQKLTDLSDGAKNFEGMVRIPGKDSSAEEIATFNKAFGLPENAEGYEIVRPENMPDGMVYDEALETKFREVAHKTGMKPDQVAAVAKLVNDHGMETYAEINKILDDRKTAAVETLKQLWPGDKYAQENDRVFKVMTAFAGQSEIPEGFGGIEGFKGWLKNSGMVNDPVFNWMASKMFDHIGNDDLFLKGGAANTSTNVPVEEQFFSESMGHKKK
ncbi:hypothetical protein LCGC14_0359600 [marine sediment metagenome]|uniref:Uncharacterized protein n=1 Tax=marine sediment metagenome TaxID=412755 RepID=A0A0F9T8I2_9ZZZZ|nr:hypothetical protein [Candidatus Aminicenantes bacterium]